MKAESAGIAGGGRTTNVDGFAFIHYSSSFVILAQSGYYAPILLAIMWQSVQMICITSISINRKLPQPFFVTSP